VDVIVSVTLVDKLGNRMAGTKIFKTSDEDDDHSGVEYQTAMKAKEAFRDASYAGGRYRYAKRTD
jgi:hypothetical protein